MLVEEMKIGNVRVKIYDDYVVSDEKKVEVSRRCESFCSYNFCTFFINNNTHIWVCFDLEVPNNWSGEIFNSFILILLCLL